MGKSTFPSFQSVQVSSSHWAVLALGQAPRDDKCRAQMARPEVSSAADADPPRSLRPRASPLRAAPSPLLPVRIMDSLHEYPILYTFTLAGA